MTQFYARRQSDTPPPLTPWSRLNTWLKANLHLIVLTLPLLFGASRVLGLEWSGSPQAIIQHVNLADSLIIAKLAEDTYEQVRQDSILTAHIAQLSDSINILWLQQGVIIGSLCNQLSAEERTLVQSTIRCYRTGGETTVGVITLPLK